MPRVADSVLLEPGVEGVHDEPENLVLLSNDAEEAVLCDGQFSGSVRS